MMTLFELRKSYEINQRKNVSAARVAQKIGVSRATYHRYEKGMSVPDLLEAAKIAAYFNITLSDLVGIIRATRKQDGPPLTELLDNIIKAADAQKN